MKILKSIAVAFSMYSRIPMPHFTWAGEDMKYHLIFFPWIGIVIASLEYLWMYVCKYFDIGKEPFALIAVVIPLLITGGFHVDGFMDTSDALSSWQEKDKRLEILKDPHIGAFSVINLLVAVLILLSAVLMMNKKSFCFWIVSFFIARTVSGISVIKIKNAKKDGLLNTESRTASTKVVFIFLLIELFIGFGYMLYLSAVLAVVQILAWGLFWGYFRKMALDKFGGITGDLAGWFVTVGEVIAAVISGIGAIWYL
ncbi:MAG: adenosylcobinamide-GDP ribazoletransferase [Butyrivibrio sp.]|nr:adenosylcobinamide-GDP ribazoletransferase [Butyrivibrio sp.]